MRRGAPRTAEQQLRFHEAFHERLLPIFAGVAAAPSRQVGGEHHMHLNKKEMSFQHHHELQPQSITTQEQHHMPTRQPPAAASLTQHHRSRPPLELPAEHLAEVAAVLSEVEGFLSEQNSAEVLCVMSEADDSEEQSSSSSPSLSSSSSSFTSSAPSRSRSSHRHSRSTSKDEVVMEMPRRQWHTLPADLRWYRTYYAWMEYYMHEQQKQAQEERHERSHHRHGSQHHRHHHHQRRRHHHHHDDGHRRDHREGKPSSTMSEGPKMETNKNPATRDERSSPRCSPHVMSTQRKPQRSSSTARGEASRAPTPSAAPTSVYERKRRERETAKPSWR